MLNVYDTPRKGAFALKSCWQQCCVGQLNELSYNFCVDTRGAGE